MKKILLVIVGIFMVTIPVFTWKALFHGPIIIQQVKIMQPIVEPGRENYAVLRESFFRIESLDAGRLALC